MITVASIAKQLDLDYSGPCTDLIDTLGEALVDAGWTMEEAADAADAHVMARLV